MNALFTRVSTISLILFVCLCNSFQLDAAKRTDEYFLLEAKLSRTTMRSMGPALPVMVDAVGNNIYMIFDEPIDQVVVNVRNANLDVIYFNFYLNPQIETVSMASWKSGYYVVEIITEKGTLVECIYKE